jgi:hypothetical protein
MRNIWNDTETLKADRGLYCVWTDIREGEATRLVAHWVDPQAENREDAGIEESFAQEETNGRCPGVHLRAA